MVDAMHIRSDDKPSEPSINLGRNTDIPVVEQRSRVEQHLENEYANRASAKRRYHSQLDQERKSDLDGMEPQTGGDIEIQIDMMHAMDSPEHRDSVKHYVLEIDCQIEDEHRG